MQKQKVYCIFTCNNIEDTDKQIKDLRDSNGDFAKGIDLALDAYVSGLDSCKDMDRDELRAAILDNVEYKQNGKYRMVMVDLTEICSRLGMDYVELEPGDMDDTDEIRAAANKYVKSREMRKFIKKSMKDAGIKYMVCKAGIMLDNKMYEYLDVAI